MRHISNTMRLLKTRVLVTGAYGLLGSNLLDAMKDEFECYGLARSQNPEVSLANVEYLQGDITHRKNLVTTCKAITPKIIFNAAAFTDVDGGETNRDACWKTNVDGVANLAYAAKLIGARLIHVSTDYVFDGSQKTPYKETDKPNPLGFYAKSKLAGENALIASGADHAIARTMILYGMSKSARLNFVTWVIDELKKGNGIRIVDDQIGQPTLASDLAVALVALGKAENHEVFHISGSEAISRYDFTLEIAKVFGLDTSLIQRIKTEDLQQPAPRPMHSVFDLTKLETELGIKMADVSEGLGKFKTSLDHT